MNQNPFGNPEQIPSGMMNGLVLTFWIAAAVVLISGVKLVSCHFAGVPLQDCGWLPHLGFLPGVFTIIGTMPFVLTDLFDHAQWSWSRDDSRSQNGEPGADDHDQPQPPAG